MKNLKIESNKTQSKMPTQDEILDACVDCESGEILGFREGVMWLAHKLGLEVG